MVRKGVVAVAGTCLALLMFLVAADVIGRYVFNRPIPGGYELVEYLMAIVVPLGVAFCAEQKSHVGVDLLVERLSAKSRRVVDGVTQLATVLLGCVLVWQTWVAVPDSYASGLKSAVLQIPVYPFVLAVGVGAAAFVLFSFAHLLERIRELFDR
jgi:TRAP-type C4-dicarboxylate transport system permease small subunit